MASYVYPECIAICRLGGKSIVARARKLLFVVGEMKVGRKNIILAVPNLQYFYELRYNYYIIDSLFQKLIKMERDKKKMARDRKRKNRFFLKEVKVDMDQLLQEKINSQASTVGKYYC